MWFNKKCSFITTSFYRYDFDIYKIFELFLIDIHVARKVILLISFLANWMLYDRHQSRKFTLVLGERFVKSTSACCHAIFVNKFAKTRWSTDGRSAEGRPAGQVMSINRVEPKQKRRKDTPARPRRYHARGYGVGFMAGDFLRTVWNAQGQGWQSNTVVGVDR